MKVLVPGSGQQGWSTAATCTGRGNGDGGCGAKLQVERSDLFETSSSARDETEYYTTFECVQCKVWTDLPRDQVPSHVRQGLPHRAPITHRRG